MDISVRADRAAQPGCALCWIDDVWSEPVKGWVGIPICREHLAQTIIRTGGHPVINPSPGSAASSTLQ
jgi:hypothetical protein